MPNIFVAVNIREPQDTTIGPEGTFYSLSNGQLRMATLELSVPDDDWRLSVTINIRPVLICVPPDCPSHGACDRRVGAPVSNAEVSLALVDEPIFALGEEPTGPIYDAFYSRRELLVCTYDGMVLRRCLGNEVRGGREGDIFPAYPRNDFLDAAIRLPSLTTDANEVVTSNLVTR